MLGVSPFHPTATNVSLFKTASFDVFFVYRPNGEKETMRDTPIHQNMLRLPSLSTTKQHQIQVSLGMFYAAERCQLVLIKSRPIGCFGNSET